MKPTYEIGQVVYILSETSESIVPGIIIEKIIIETLNNNSVSWKIQIGGKEKNQIVDTSQIKQEIYGSLEEISEALKKRLNSYLLALISKANNKAISWYGEERVNNKKASLPQSDKVSINNLDSFVSTSETKTIIPTTQEDLRNKLKQSMFASEEEIAAETLNYE